MAEPVNSNGINFVDEQPVRPTAPNRVDVACFVGFVALRPEFIEDSDRIPSSIVNWLVRRGWLPNDIEEFDAARHRADARRLADVPIPIDDWGTFDMLFDWENRPVVEDSTEVHPAYLGNAVRSFFAEGGRRCYVVRMGSPLPWRATSAEREAQLVRITSQGNAAASDRTSWHGIGHLFGLDDVSFLALPDLVDVVRINEDVTDVKPVDFPVLPEEFVECTPNYGLMPDDSQFTVGSPVCDEPALVSWREAVSQVVTFVHDNLREVEMVISLPLMARREIPHDEHRALIYRDGWFAGSVALSGDGIASSFLQLAYPWLRTTTSRSLPGGIEPPDGRLVGMLARNALFRGTFRSSTAIASVHIEATSPEFTARALYAERDALMHQRWVDRVTTFAPTPQGVRLISDVTTSSDPAYRNASIGRTMAFIIRTARRIGEEVVFETSGPALWDRVRDTLQSFLLALFHQGALDGSNTTDAFDVRCDRTTMTQQDIDAGRVIAVISVRPVSSIERIDVALTLNPDDPGAVRLLAEVA